MTALIFLLIGIAMIAAVTGHRGTAIGLFGVSFVAAVVWLERHMTDPLNLVL